jgi:hypothetical protein
MKMKRSKYQTGSNDQIKTEIPEITATEININITPIEDPPESEISEFLTGTATVCSGGSTKNRIRKREKFNTSRKIQNSNQTEPRIEFEPDDSTKVLFNLKSKLLTINN